MKSAIFFLYIISTVHCWDSDQLEVFDVVEEVKVNFYEMLNIEKDANSTVIRTAFRKLSVVWHPDKNLNEDTSEKFRNLVSVYEVLKDSKKRAYYDDVLVNGMPNWKSAIYYYRSVRKMGILESSIILFFIITIGQYLVSWASYFEKQYTIEQQIKYRKVKKGQAPIIMEEIPKPSVYNTLPFQIPYSIYYCIISLPSFILFLKDVIAEKIATSMAKEEEESEEEIVEKEPKVRRRRPKLAIPEGPNFEVQSTNDNVNHSEVSAPPISGGLWTDDDLDELIQLVKKFPGGTPKRWDVIAEHIGRSVAEVTFMANRMKNNGYKLPSQEEEIVVEEKVKQKTKGGKTGNVEESHWTQPQQKALEDALMKYTKGVGDRWDRISEAVPEKSKEECMLRYKHLVEKLKKQKEQ